MSLWNKLGAELRTAGKAAQGAIDEGKLRLEIFRVRQHADKAAQVLGYAVHRARRDGGELDPAELERLDGTLAEHENEANKLEADLQANVNPAAPPSPAANARSAE